MERILLYFALKYKGNWMKIFEAIKRKEEFKEYELEEMLKNQNSKYITYISEDFPKCFKNITYPPFVLFYRGDISLLDASKKVSIVGSRKASSYGLRMTSKLTEEFVDKGYVIVSGLAKGVDAMAHQTCLDHKGKTIAFIAGGCDTKYPLDNSDLYDDILDKGGVIISEFPDGIEPARNNFDMRNRLIAAAGDMLVVTEAYERSGTLLTLRHALFLSKDVYCVPYRAEDNSLCNRVIKDGANIIESVDDVLENIS